MFLFSKKNSYKKLAIFSPRKLGIYIFKIPKFSKQKFTNYRGKEKR
jgi:hypothetical protein